MQTPHTPGPWHTGPYCVWGGIQGDTFVAGTKTGLSDAQALANGLLIAAAPDLLEALQRLQCECTEEWPLELVELVDAAITKAGGVSA